jgi:hypothetical protein
MCGNEDLAAAIGARRIKDESGAMLEVFRVVRALALLAGSAAGIGIIDSPVVELAASEVLQRESDEAAAMGYTGKLAIHPAQVAPINAAFLPTPAEIEQAQSLPRGARMTARFASRTGWSIPMCAAPAHHGARPRARIGVTRLRTTRALTRRTGSRRAEVAAA